MKLTEDDIRKITLNAINELGEKASPALVKKVVGKAVEDLKSVSAPLQKNDTSTGRVILTAFGLNKSGIVAAITKSLGESDCDIHDLSQKLMDDFFTMIMVIDISNSPKDLKAIQDEMSTIAEKLKIKVYLQHEDIFRNMHRI
ncbi:MAG: ACT domain-containing protein [Melioribacteraceae bacterium]|nr:MAG: ACT domain-containing protein [Melioribacteraceae bacterium]